MMEDDLGMGASLSAFHDAARKFIYQSCLLDPELRSNALLFAGPPIAHLPTQRIFAYATHFEAHPLGLEWVSDTTCVLVFSNRSSARKAYSLLQRSLDESPSIEDGSVTAKPIPVPLWPAEKQLSRTLEQTLGIKAPAEESDERMKREAGLSAPLRMRWARKDDVKKKGARKESEFYRKHGSLAGKEVVNGRDIPNLPGSAGRKRHREDEDDDAEAQRRKLDRELDAFLEDRSDAEQQEQTDDSRPASPPSKMRSDYIASNGRSQLQKSSRDGHGRRRDGRRGRGKGNELSGLSLSERISGGPVADVSWGRESKRRRGPEGGESGGGRRGRDARPHKTQQELDDELDAFLNAPSAS